MEGLITKLGQNTNNILSNWSCAWDPYCYFGCTQIMVLEWETISYKFDWTQFLIFQSFVALIWVWSVKPVCHTGQTGLSRDSFPRTLCRNYLETSDGPRKFLSYIRSSNLYCSWSASFSDCFDLKWSWDDMIIFFDPYGA